MVAVAVDGSDLLPIGMTMTASVGKGLPITDLAEFARVANDAGLRLIRGLQDLPTVPVDQASAVHPAAVAARTAMRELAELVATETVGADGFAAHLHATLAGHRGNVQLLQTSYLAALVADQAAM